MIWVGVLPNDSMTHPSTFEIHSIWEVKVLKILAATDTMTMLAMMVMDTMTMITTAMTMDMAIMAMMVLGMNLVATIAMLVKM